MHYILIIILSAVNTTSSSLTSIEREFHSLNSCIAAGDKILKDVTGFGRNRNTKYTVISSNCTSLK